MDKLTINGSIDSLEIKKDKDGEPYAKVKFNLHLDKKNYQPQFDWFRANIKQTFCTTIEIMQTELLEAEGPKGSQQD